MMGLLLAIIQLVGVAGGDLRARAFFDANNVKVGDPLVLTIDFIGEADLRDIHPPALSRAVVKSDWKVDDISAKTDTFRDARRLTYRVRPMREGVLYFPELEFEYLGPKGERRTVRSNAIPVHAKGGQQVVVEGMDEIVEAGMPKPPELTTEPSVQVDDDTLFAWRRALANPTADAFAAFDFPAAKLNEASCAIKDGNWARAMKIYSALEWRIGQTSEVERGMVCALALKFDNPQMELPVWRQVLRPVLKYGWQGRIGIMLGALLSVYLLFWLFGRGIRALACVVIGLGLALPSSGADLFELMERQMQKTMSGFNFHFGEQEDVPPVKIVGRLETNKSNLQVGDAFEFIVSLECPKTASIGRVQLSATESFGLNFTGEVTNLPDAAATNPSNVIHRLSVPVRYDVPLKGKVAFVIEGMVSQNVSSSKNRFFSFSNSFRCVTDEMPLVVMPLPTAGQPADFDGIVSAGLRIHETCDILLVETNDVITITYKMYPQGYLPKDYLPRDSAFEWGRRINRDGTIAEVEYRRFWVADGASATPKLSISYYDPRSKTYRKAETGATPIKYKKTGQVSYE